MVSRGKQSRMGIQIVIVYAINDMGVLQRVFKRAGGAVFVGVLRRVL